MAEFQRIVLVHYHEIGLKGHNRATFEMRLLRNLEALLKEFPLVTIRRISGRLCVFLKEGTPHNVMLEVAGRCRFVPGVARVSSGFKCDRDVDLMGQACIHALSEAGDFQTFKVQARRNHTDFPIPSPDMNQIFGAVLCENFPEKGVKMKQPTRRWAWKWCRRRPTYTPTAKRASAGFPWAALGA